MSIIHIEDPDDPRLAEFRNVPDPELLGRHKLFVAEGRLVVRRLLLESRLPALSVMVTQAALAPLQEVVDPRDLLPVYVVPQAVMNGITGYNMHRGCVALGERPQASEWRELTNRAQYLLALERVGNADNVGSAFRSASAFGVDAVLLESGCADPLYRKAIRTSMGASLTIPFAPAEPWPDMLYELRNKGWAVVGMTASSRTKELREIAPMIARHPTVIVLGHEGDGLSDEALEACSHRARIPMTNRVDSLNVATAAAIALYELVRG
ncbi:MAG TPA: RNA methyltransferase [Vicinamibacterales bacterium]|nr:RNA methyltransferase [Vicinamibacterales bacterium]